MTNKNSKNKNMKKQINEFKRMQRLAGLLKESQLGKASESKFVDFGPFKKVEYYTVGGENTVTLIVTNSNNFEKIESSMPVSSDRDSYTKEEIKYLDNKVEELANEMSEYLTSMGIENEILDNPIGYGQEIDNLVIDINIDDFNKLAKVDTKVKNINPIKNSLKENESSAYITIDPEFPNEVELYADSGDYAGDIEKNGKVTFTLTFDEGDSEGTYMNSKDIFDDHAPAVFKKIVKAGGDFDAGDDYVEVTTTLDKLKKLFPMKESSKNSLKENDLANDDLIYDRMLNMDQEQLISKILNYAEKNPTSTLVDYLNSEFGYGEEDY
jgi:hypothetical protein